MLKALLTLMAFAFLTAGALPVPGHTQTSVFVYSDAGYYNKSYRTWEYKTRPVTSFPVLMMNIGTEFRHCNSEGDIFGGGVSGAVINGGETKNWVYTERQERMTVVVPYMFVGHDFPLWGLELGVCYYINTSLPARRGRYEEDGSEKRESKSIFFKRTDSYALPNFSIRVLNEKSLHFKIRFCRERFHAIDNILNIAAFLPYGRLMFEAYAALPTHISQYFPRSNQRAGIAASFSLDPFIVGLDLGYLVNNYHGGGGIGATSFRNINHYSAGFFAGVRW